MDEVARLARALVDEDETVRLRGITALARYPRHPTAVAELMESLKNDLLGELSIVAAIALADMARVNPRVTDAVAARYRATVGSVALYGGYDPTLRLTYFFAISGNRDWFREPRPADLRAGTAEYRTHIARYLAAGRDADVGAAARSMVWFEALDTAGNRRMFTAARKLLPGWNAWFRPLTRATSRHP
ncbi:hypothetical protein [Actinophytocola sp. NPDC049390]|uniref:hypothetical protein n=1 Tax=Actinophytocola sp. NPDC049390 TaxID=3363894 RepID=UPI0037AC4779